MRKPRKSYTPAEKVAILRRHLIDHAGLRPLRQVPASAIDLLRLAEAVLRERCSRLPAQERVARAVTPADHRGPPRQVATQERGRRGIDGGPYPAKKRAWGTLNSAWVPHDVRDAIVDYVGHWSGRTEIPIQRFVIWLGVAASKFYDWRARHGLANEHNALVPRDWWLEGWEKRAILDFHARHPLEGYRRLAFMMLDADVVAVSPSSVYRVLHAAGVMKTANSKSHSKERAFSSPCGLTSTGMSISRTSTLPGRSTTCAAFSMAAVGSSFTGRSAKP